MEKAYRLGRKRTSLKRAQKAACAEDRLIHYDLAGRYSLKALPVESPAIDLADVSPFAFNAGGMKPSAKEASNA